MKRRDGFVTNSSSSSFLISKKNLSETQLEAVRKHSKLGLKLKLDYAEQAWDIDETENFISGYTSMDNYMISELFDIIGVSAYVSWNTNMGADEAESKLNGMNDEFANENDNININWKKALIEINDNDDLEEVQ